MLRYRRVYRVAVVLCLAMIVLIAFVSVVTAHEGSTYNIVFLIDGSNSMTGGGGLNVNNDPEDRRIRFARFLVRYLQMVHSEQSRIGVIRFYGKVREEDRLVPLTWVNAWSLADLKKIGAVDVEGLNNTSFEEGLKAARQYFVDETGQTLHCGNRTDNEKCYVLLFSDGEFEGKNLDQQKNIIAGLLADLRQNQQIQVIPILFGENQDSEWWQENAGVMVNGDMDRQAVYAEILQHLGLGAPSEHFEKSTLFSVSTTLSLATATPFHQVVSVTLIADDLMLDNWNIAPAVKGASERWWLNPPFGEIQGTLQRSPEAQPGETLVYYTFGESFYPLDVLTALVPERAHINQPIQLSAQLVVRGQSFVNTSVTIRTHLEPSGETISLQPTSEGHFTGSITPTTPGTYTVTFVPIVPITWTHGALNEAQQQFYVDDKLYLTSLETSVLPEKVAVGDMVKIRGRFLYDGQPMPQMEGFEIKAEVQPGSVPLLLMQGEDGWWEGTITPTLAGAYTATLISVTPFSYNHTIKNEVFSSGLLPQLDMIVGQRITTTSGFDIPITVTVAHYTETISGLYAPILHYKMNDQLKTSPLVSVGGSKFYTILPVSSTSRLILTASLPSGSTVQGIPFHDNEIQKTFLWEQGRVQYVVNNNLKWQFLIMGALTVALPMIAVTLLYQKKVMPVSINHHDDLADVLSKEASKIKKSDILEVFKRPDGFPRNFLDFAKESSKLIIDSIFEK
ncbi:MAG TPA: vWA domain-containing protein [Anaerolineae bacterium]|nr:vWA domain-containing protein [Anaerolineae bacterium]HQH36937.1 vWA domain-containing protein [Anaerolineae bacterium]